MREMRYGDRNPGRPTVSLLAVGIVLSLSASAVSVIRHSPAPPSSARAVTAIAVEAASPDPVVLAAPSPAPAPRGGTCPAAPSMPADDTLVLTAQTRSVAVHDGPGGRVQRQLPSPTRDGQPLHLRVMETAGEWHRVQMPERPNSTTGWVRGAGMTRSRAPYRILLQRCSRQLTLFRDGRPVFDEPIAIGKPQTPTPLGDFYVDFVESWRPDSPYGPWLISVTGFSDVYQTFGEGGVGQIGIHGTQAASSVGKPTSNGCIRMQNDAITRLAGLVVAGTPVLVVD